MTTGFTNTTCSITWDYPTFTNALQYADTFDAWIAHEERQMYWPPPEEPKVIDDWWDIWGEVLYD